ncbi:hypothetical protein OF377_02190 [Ureaplasma sp. ES3154-GEN]|uniref:hypothetical protein n=1 Tax=Ureaplasma sp. ES3154-GEN TaxID=2984844 RepID=UPI0021E7371D|nr:hypothetical protein [Ureaplasma sp. ES3154-GEN]MCV3743679.1 hypothetical protein [Ureaplasma sp. ES3154-GEN]
MNKTNKHNATLFLSKKQAEKLGIIDLDNQQVVINNRFVESQVINSFADEVKLEKLVTKAYTFYNEENASKPTLLNVFDDYDYQSQNISFLTYYEAKVYGLVREYFLEHELKTRDILDYFLSNDPFKTWKTEELEVLQTNVVNWLTELNLDIEQVKQEIVDLEDNHDSNHLLNEDGFILQKAKLEASLDIQLTLLYLLTLIEQKTNPNFADEWAKTGYGTERIPGAFTTYDYRVRREYLDQKNYKQMVQKIKTNSVSSTSTYDEKQAMKLVHTPQEEAVPLLPKEPELAITPVINSDEQTVVNLKENEFAHQEEIKSEPELTPINAIQQPVAVKNEAKETVILPDFSSFSSANNGLNINFNSTTKKEVNTVNVKKELEKAITDEPYHEVEIKEDYVQDLYERHPDVYRVHHETEMMWKNEANVDMIFENDDEDHNSEDLMVPRDTVNLEEVVVKETTNEYIEQEILRYETMLRDLNTPTSDTEKEEKSVTQSKIVNEQECCRRLDRTIDECITCYLNHPRPIIDPRVKYLDQRLEILENMQRLKNNVGYLAVSEEPVVQTTVLQEVEVSSVEDSPAPIEIVKESELIEEDLVTKYSDLNNLGSHKFKILDERIQTLENMAKYQNETPNVYYLEEDTSVQVDNVNIEDLLVNQPVEEETVEKIDTFGNETKDRLDDFLNELDNNTLDVKEVEANTDWLIDNHQEYKNYGKKTIPWFRRKRRK